jgi:mRNA-degrading endonuclease RelE of RelBE toxin-antitoxin system
MITYRVFIAAEVITLLRSCPRREQQIFTRLFEELAKDPYRVGDYAERDEVGRPVQVLIVGGRAVYFWADHPVKEVKVVDLRPAGR